MRTGTPIFTTRAILDETGFIMEQQDDESDNNDEHSSDSSSYEIEPEPKPKLENYTIEELERTLSRLIDDENYEEAAKVSEILKRKKENLI